MVDDCMLVSHVYADLMPWCPGEWGCADVLWWMDGQAVEFLFSGGTSTWVASVRILMFQINT